MSTSLTCLIPTDPTWVPGPDVEVRVRDLIAEFLPDHGEVTVERPAAVTLYTAHESFEDILKCPRFSSNL